MYSHLNTSNGLGCTANAVQVSLQNCHFHPFLPIQSAMGRTIPQWLFSAADWAGRRWKWWSWVDCKLAWTAFIVHHYLHTMHEVSWAQTFFLYGLKAKNRTVYSFLNTSDGLQRTANLVQASRPLVVHLPSHLISHVEEHSTEAGLCSWQGQEDGGEGLEWAFANSFQLHLQYVCVPYYLHSRHAVVP